MVALRIFHLSEGGLQLGIILKGLADHIQTGLSTVKLPVHLLESIKSQGCAHGLNYIRCPRLRKRLRNLVYESVMDNFRSVDGLLREVEVVVNCLGQVDDERVGDIPNVLDGMIGVDRKYKVASGGIHNTDIAGIVHYAIT